MRSEESVNSYKEETKINACVSLFIKLFSLLTLPSKGKSRKANRKHTNYNSVIFFSL